MAGSAAQHLRPEQEALDVGPRGAHDPLVADLAVEHRLVGHRGHDARQRVHRARQAAPVPVPGLEHLVVGQGRVGEHVQRGGGVDARAGVDGHGSVPRVQGAGGPGHDRPARGQARGVGGRLGQEQLVIPGQRRLARDDPDDRHRSVARHELPPMCRHHARARVVQVVAPRPHDAGHETRLEDDPEPPVGRVEVGRPRRPPARLPREAAHRFPARLELAHLGQRPDHELDQREPLGHALLRQLPQLRIADAGRERVPPGIAQPQERRAVLVLEVSTTGGHPHRPMPPHSGVGARPPDGDDSRWRSSRADPSGASQRYGCAPSMPDAYRAPSPPSLARNGGMRRTVPAGSVTSSHGRGPSGPAPAAALPAAPFASSCTSATA